MDLLADENIYVDSVVVLREAGHDVLSILEEHPSMPDPDILALAVETQRILVTRDRDFGELVFGRGLPAPPAILYIRLRRVRRDAYGLVARELLSREGERVMGQLITMNQDGERWRPLPGVDSGT